MCDFAVGVWKKMASWLEVSSVPFIHTKEHLEAFSDSLGKSGKKILEMVWHGTVWIIWKARNGKLFGGEDQGISETFEKIKFMLCSWVRSHKLVLPEYDYIGWEVRCRGVLNLL